MAVFVNQTGCLFTTVSSSNDLGHVHREGEREGGYQKWTKPVSKIANTKSENGNGKHEIINILHHYKDMNVYAHVKKLADK